MPQPRNLSRGVAMLRPCIQTGTPHSRGLCVCLSALFFLVAACLPGRVWAQAQAMGSGGGWFDCDNDGYLDLCCLTPQGQISLLIYNPLTQKFTDQTATGIPAALQSSYPGVAVACGDVNNDGFADLFMTFAGPNHLLLNNGDDTFTTVSRTAGILPTSEGDVLSASAAFLDYDGDGLLDIYVANYEGHANQLFHNDGIDNSGVPHFTDVAPDLGVDWAQNGESNWSLGLAVGDYDNDGDPDIYVANDYDGYDDYLNLKPGPNILYRNEGNGTFTDVTYSAGDASDGDRWAMGASFGDYNGDGWLDIFVANFWDDSLLRNNRDGTFTDVTAMVGIPAAKPATLPETPPCTVCNGWGSSFLDYDNDGDLDIHVANGFITNSENQIADEPNELWENRGLGSNGYTEFVQVGVQAGIANIGDARGAAYADFNRDGFVDILVVNNNYVADPGSGSSQVPQRLLFVNKGNGTFQEQGLSYGIRAQGQDGVQLSPRGDFTGNHWIEVRPIGTVSNRSGYGTRITVEAGGKTWIQDMGTGSYVSSNSPYLHFGLGEQTLVDHLTVRFPSGTVVGKASVPVDQTLIIHENDPSPVRLLSFTVTGETEGARVRWSYVDDGNLTAFAVSRIQAGLETVLSSAVVPRDGNGEFLDREAPAGEAVFYALDALYRDGSRERLGTVAFRLEPGTAPSLRQNFPNPFASATLIPVTAPPGATPVLRIFDTSGQLVRTLTGTASAPVRWDGRDTGGRPVPAGTYFIRVTGMDRTLKVIHQP